MLRLDSILPGLYASGSQPLSPTAAGASQPLSPTAAAMAVLEGTPTSPRGFDPTAFLAGNGSPPPLASPRAPPGAGGSLPFLGGATSGELVQDEGRADLLLANLADLAVRPLPVPQSAAAGTQPQALPQPQWGAAAAVPPGGWAGPFSQQVTTGWAGPAPAGPAALAPTTPAAMAGSGPGAALPSPLAPPSPLPMPLPLNLPPGPQPGFLGGMAAGGPSAPLASGPGASAAPGYGGPGPAQHSAASSGSQLQPPAGAGIPRISSTGNFGGAAGGAPGPMVPQPLPLAPPARPPAAPAAAAPAAAAAAAATEPQSSASRRADSSAGATPASDSTSKGRVGEWKGCGCALRPAPACRRPLLWALLCNSARQQQPAWPTPLLSCRRPSSPQPGSASPLAHSEPCCPSPPARSRGRGHGQPAPCRLPHPHAQAPRQGRPAGARLHARTQYLSTVIKPLAP